MGTARDRLGGAGNDNTTALAFGGNSGSVTTATEEYNQFGPSTATITTT